MYKTSVVDPNTLNLDPDQGVWPNLVGSGSRSGSWVIPLYYQFWKKKEKRKLQKNNFLQKQLFKKTINQMLPKEMFTQLSLFIVNLPYILNPGLWICIHFLGIQIQHFFWMQIWIRIQKVKWMKIHVDLDPAKQTL